MVRSGFVVVLAACSGSAGPTLPADELADAIVAAQCEHAVTCGDMPDQATCLASRHADNILLTTVADILDGTIHYEEHRGAACVAFLRDRPCFDSGGDYVSAVVDLNLPHDNQCILMFDGTVGDGQTCNARDQCAAFGDCFGPACDWHTSCCTGTCAAHPIVGIGDSCTGAHCPDGAYCEDTCKLQITTEGASCNETDACAPPLACVISRATLMGTCVRQPPPPPGGCPCANGEVCNSTGTCVPRALVGEPCADASSCVGYADCLGSPSVCVARILPGQPCMIAVGAPICLGDATCINGVCTLPPAGVACP